MVERSELAKGYQVDRDAYVLVSNDELKKKLAEETAKFQSDAEARFCVDVGLEFTLGVGLRVSRCLICGFVDAPE